MDMDYVATAKMVHDRVAKIAESLTSDMHDGIAAKSVAHFESELRKGRRSFACGLIVVETAQHREGHEQMNTIICDYVLPTDRK